MASWGADGEALRPGRGRAHVEFNQREGSDHWRLRLAPETWSGSRPGQFLMLGPGPVADAVRYDPLLPRPMAVFRSDGFAVEILYKVMGRGTALLASARRGDRIEWVGPLGVPFELPATGAPALLVGGGTGIASLYELAEACAARGPVQVLLGARTRDDLMAEADFEALSGIELRVATEDGSAGHRGLVTELLEAGLDEFGRRAAVFACGPTPMMERAAQLAAGASATCQVSLENHMACGFGVCLGCAVPRDGGGFALVCREGPVFAGSAVSWPGLAT